MTVQDFYAAYAYASKEELISKVIQDKSLDLGTKLNLLAMGLKDDAKGLKELGRSIYKETVTGENKPSLYQKFIIIPHLSFMKRLGLAGGESVDLESLPLYSAFLKFTFTLAKPFISRDDAPFHILDNPLRKDRVFWVPMVGSGTWKGNLRWMANYLTVARWRDQAEAVGRSRAVFLAEFSQQWRRDRLQLYRLFGPESQAMSLNFDNVITGLMDPEIPEAQISDAFSTYLKDQGLPQGEDQGFQGRLRFFSTFFDAIGLEIINPHDPESGAGKLPIVFESAPAGSRGTFSLLYVPFDLLGMENLESVKHQALNDLQLVSQALEYLMMIHGFSAKKTSGFGVIQEEVKEGEITVKSLPQPTSQPIHRLGDLPTVLARMGG